MTIRVFSTHFSVLGYPDETLFLVFDILHIVIAKPKYNNCDSKAAFNEMFLNIKIFKR